MKISKINIFTLGLIGLSVLSFDANANQCSGAQKVKFGLPVAYSKRHPKPFQDVWAWCSNAISELESVRFMANESARAGDLGGAAAQLYDGLMKNSSNVNSYFNPAPHTADAILVGINIAEETFAATQESNPNMIGRLSPTLRYLMLDSVYTFIFETYKNLDQRFFADIANVCRGRNCYDQQNTDHYGSLPREYYDGMRELSINLLDTQRQLAHMQGTNELEMRVTRAVAAGARDMMLSSVIRRSLACPAKKLDFIVGLINRYIGCGNNPTSPTQVMGIRRLLAEAQSEATYTQCQENYFPRQWR